MISPVLKNFQKDFMFRAFYKPSERTGKVFYIRFQDDADWYPGWKYSFSIPDFLTYTDELQDLGSNPKLSTDQVFFKAGLKYFVPEAVAGNPAQPLTPAFLTKHAGKAIHLWQPLVSHLVDLYFTESKDGETVIGIDPEEKVVDIAAEKPKKAKEQKKSST